MLSDARPHEFTDSDHKIIQKVYIVDEWLILTDDGPTNTLIADDSAYRVDIGGALLYWQTDGLKDDAYMEQAMEKLKKYDISEDEMAAVSRIANISDEQIKWLSLIHI